MNKTKILFMILVAFGISHFASAQEKYAVLITGDYAAANIPTEEQWNQGQGRSAYGFDEFWNDTFLMWKMLQDKGYSQENIIVLFADGSDFTFLGQAEEYIPEEGEVVTDYSASIANVNLVFNGLAHGLNGFPRVTENDFLFVWTFDHGGTTGGGNSTLHLIDGTMTDAAFANLVNPIQAHKKVFWMQQCFAGGFADNLSANNTFFHSASQPNQSAYRADNETNMNQLVIENEEISNKKYHHGEFNFHTYSVTNGASPAGFTNYFGEPYTDADTQPAYQGNNDGFISMKESSEWEKLHESEPGTPLVDDPGSIGAYTSLEYPTLIWKNVVNNKTVRGIIGVTKDVHVTAGHTLTFKSLSKVTFLNNAKLIVDEGATLVIEPGAKFYNGDMEIYMSSTPFEISQVYFESTKINCKSNLLKVNDCDFLNMSELRGFESGNIEINECYFTKSSHLILQNPDDFTGTAIITNNEFNNYRSTYDPLASYDAMYLDKVSNYTITNNTINGYFNGINIAKSGYGKGDASIKNNTIGHAYTGICFYSNQGIIKNNHIYGNYTGVKLLNHSSSELLGDVNAQDPKGTQLIRDNAGSEVYASQYSFPKIFKYNVVIDEDNNDSGTTADYLLYWDTEVGTMRKVNIHYNCWGENFDAPNDLYPDPYQMYNYSYIWCPPTNGGTPAGSAAYILYNQAQSQINNEDYVTAGNTLKSLITQYPNTNYAQYAIKDLYEVEKLKSSAKSNGDFAALQDYYQNNTSIQNDMVLQKMVNFWINQCDIALAHYDEAIAHYESIINQPESLQDSIFAVIDLGDLYLMMEENDKGNKAVGKITTCIPTSEKAHKANSNYLISLLPFNKKMAETENENSSANTGTLLQNSPNPTQGITTIGYQLEKEVKQVSIVIYDYTGKTVQRIEDLGHTAGKNSTEINLTQLPAGTYFYSLFVNGHKSDTKKLVLIH